MPDTPARAALSKPLSAHEREQLDRDLARGIWGGNVACLAIVQKLLARHDALEQLRATPARAVPSEAAWKAALAALGDEPAGALMEDPSCIDIALRAAYAVDFPHGRESSRTAGPELGNYAAPTQAVPSEAAVQAGAQAYRNYRDEVYAPSKPAPRDDGDHTAALAEATGRAMYAVDFPHGGEPSEAARNEILDVIVWLRNEADHEAFAGGFAHADEVRRQADRLGCAVDSHYGGETSKKKDYGTGFMATVVRREQQKAAHGGEQRALEKKLSEIDSAYITASDESPAAHGGELAALERPTIRAYLAGQGDTIPSWFCPEAATALVLNGYQLHNVRWLLRHAWSGTAPSNLNTGDWCGEILWAVEQALLDLDAANRDNVHGPNQNDADWPLQGWAAPTRLRAALKAAKEERE